ncbi:MAG TPA: hypothetical protein VFA07_05740 [Chthonomonadaceae bacterium]|nr:hypothetical protein [Chthonomonadaceae bacterium]
MLLTRRNILCALLVGLLGCSPHAPLLLNHPAAKAQEASTGVTYELTPLPQRSSREMLVAMHIPVEDPSTPISLQMPVWAPGDYHVQNFALYVRNLRAVEEDGGESVHTLAVSHPDQNTWKITPGTAHKILVTYALPEEPPGLFSQNAQVLPDQAFVNGPAAYMYIVGHKDVPATLIAHVPVGWDVVVALPHAHDFPPETPAYTAPDYDTLADSPVVMMANNAVVTREFKLKGVTHLIVLFGQPDRVSDPDAYVPVLQKIAQAENTIMGVTPYARYDFLFDIGGVGGGLEHLNCCRIGFPGQPAYLGALAAHEFFHLWNVKRIRPRVLGPFDYIHPPHTRNLWFCEGVTEYYAHIALRRSGQTTLEEFLNHWRRAIEGLQSNPARLKVTADESSLRVWEADNSEGYGGLSYYQKGELIGLCMDLAIRHATNNRSSLDTMMRLLMERYGLPKPGYGEDDLRAVFSEVAGKDLSALYDLMARSTEEMPFKECLGYAGLDTDLNPLPDASPEQIALRKSWMAGPP